MAKQKITVSTGAISLSNRVADKLIAGGDGNAALLYLYILRQGGYFEASSAVKALGLTAEQLTSAFTQLEQLELIKGPDIEPEPEKNIKDAPRYSAEVIRHELDIPSSFFPGLLKEVERKLGNKLNYQNMQILMELYDYLALPAEVILLLVAYMIDEAAYRKGPGIKPRMWEIQREGYRWSARGLDNLDTATAYVTRMNYFRTNEGQILSMVGIQGRTATDREKSYINAWLEMGFEDGVIQMAYERTLFKVQKWNWSYCNGILKNWHKNNLHTLNAIYDAERQSRPAGTANHPAGGSSVAASAGNTDQFDDFIWLQEYMNKHESGQNGGN